MKNKYSQDFPENFGEDPNDNSDTSLIAFLKQNKPIAPSPAPNFEEQLFAEISKYPQRSPQPLKSNLRRWLPWTVLIPAAIATGIGFNWATNRVQYQIANISEAERVEIEQSLLNSWDATDTTISQTTGAAITPDSQLLVELSPLEYE